MVPGTPLRIVPSVFEDELISSYWRRLVDLNCGQAFRNITRWLFAAPWRSPAHSLPGYIDAFTQEIGRLAGIPDAGRWLHAHTHFPLYAAGLSPERQAQLRDRMLYARAGPIAPCIALLSAETFRRTIAVCPQCRGVDVQRAGVAYWRRVHNAPAVLYCLLHECRLERICSTDGCIVKPSCELNSRATARKVDNALRLAHSASGLLGLSQAELEIYSRALRQRAAQACGYGAGARVRYARLAELVCERYSGGFELPEIDSLVSHPHRADQWLQALFRPRARVHPTLVMLLLGALDETVSAVRATAIETVTRKPLDRADCLDVLRSSQTLTHAAQQLGVSVTTVAVAARRHGIAFSSRPSRLTPQRRTEICRRLARGDGIESIAAHANVGAQSVYRVLAAEPSTRAAREDALRARLRRQYRNRWQRLCSRYPTLSHTQLRRQAPGAWVWLYRHDRDWLKSCPASTPRARSNFQYGARAAARLPWLEVARQLEEALIEARARILRKPDAARVTRPALLRVAGFADDLDSGPAVEHLYAVVDRLVESTFEFVVRRLRYALSESDRAGQSIDAWALVRVARLRPSTVKRAGIDVDRWLRANHRVAP